MELMVGSLPGNASILLAADKDVGVSSAYHQYCNAKRGAVLRHIGYELRLFRPVATDMTLCMPKESSMRKQAPIIEWMIVQNDVDWERRRILPLLDSEPVAKRHRPLKRYCWGVAALLLLLVGAGDWWRMTQAGSLQAEAEP